MNSNIGYKLKCLERNKFRSSFKLAGSDLEKAKELFYSDLGKLQKDCIEIIWERLVPMYPKNDGKQTPYTGHPVFTAQHGTATCCRSCLMKWHGIKKGKELEKDEIIYICKLIRIWIRLNII